mgnify:CR=1 FL=1
MKKIRQYRSNQGRSPKQTESNYKVVLWSFVGLIITFLYILVTQ